MQPVRRDAIAISELESRQAAVRMLVAQTWWGFVRQLVQTMGRVTVEPQSWVCWSKPAEQVSGRSWTVPRLPAPRSRCLASSETLHRKPFAADRFQDASSLTDCQCWTKGCLGEFPELVEVRLAEKERSWVQYSYSLG